MGLFGFGKKKEEKLVKCDCGGMCKPSEIAAKKAAEEAKHSGCCSVNANDIAKAQTNTSSEGVKVLGSGCAKCNQLEAATKEALQSLGMDTTIEHVRDFSDIAAYGVMSTPALVVDGKVVSYGKVLKADEVATLLKKARA